MWLIWPIMKKLFKMFTIPNGFIFLFLAVCVLSLLFYIQLLVENQNNPTTISMVVPVKPDQLKTSPPSHPKPSKEAVEMAILKNLIAWPSTPLLPVNFSWNDTSDPAHSSLTVLPREEEVSACNGAGGVDTDL
ncbi:hypothetical protein OJAV_G00219330 [Oryzias javanicus]|uniref:Uncharacterized protein n=1 Tax=Oryzias javanicus TaxID=123683 RepID=A0A437C190_ORYJA|nr:hypothetical protein OJAV_G00219330 [Oryzias javanicus]